MLRQIIGNDDIMLDIALALFEHLIVNNISLNNCIDWFHKLSVAPEILLPLLHNTHHKQHDGNSSSNFANDCGCAFQLLLQRSFANLLSPNRLHDATNE